VIDTTLLTGQALGMLAMGFVIVFAILVTVRLLYGVVAGVNTTEELATRDNFAFGISLAGATIGIAIMLTGVASGGVAASFVEEAAVLITYSIAGLFMMWLTRLVFDRISISTYSIRAEIHDGNIAVAIVDAGNIIATAIMVRAVMQWSDGALAPALTAVAVGYVVSQVILTATTAYRVWLFRRRNAGESFQQAVKGGNVAVALRFVGFQIGVALAVTAASQLVIYEAAGNPVTQALVWGAFSVGMAVALVALTALAERFVLARIDVSEEVDRQQNIGVGLTEVAVYVAIGLLLTSLLA
jgi:uncharacterized membrane protein YjfL (UPF0719 family)